MDRTFSDAEGLRVAIEMELRGGDFYRRAARISRCPDTVSLLATLADDEALHAREFQRLRDQLASDAPYDAETGAYLAAVAADIAFPGGLMALRDKGFEDPEAILNAAIASEKDSILFYTELAACTRDERARAAFVEIARQERGHLALLLSRREALGGKGDELPWKQ